MSVRISTLRFAFLILTALPLGACHKDYTYNLSCSGPAQSVVPSSKYAGRSETELRSLAQDGDLAAARVLGERYEHGDAVPIDPARAAGWFEQAAFVPPATSFIAAPKVGNTGGFLVPVTSGVAMPGDALALADLARLYAAGWGVPRDDLKAQKLMSCAILRGAATMTSSLNWRDEAPSNKPSPTVPEEPAK